MGNMGLFDSFFINGEVDYRETGESKIDINEFKFYI
jgi:hypothetical protein